VNRLRDIDTADRASLLLAIAWISPPALLFGAGAVWMLYSRQLISGAAAIATLIVSIPISVAVAWAVSRAAGRCASLIGGMIHANQGIARRSDFSAIDSLIIRGQHAEALSRYELLVAAEPDNMEAHFRMASLHAMHLNAPEAAEQIYLRLRRRSNTMACDRRISNALIDLYRRLGRRDRLMVELARFASINASGPDGLAARRHLEMLKADELGIKADPPDRAPTD
jgi:hypothetical protein